MKLLDHYKPRIENAEKFALRSRVLLLQSESNIGIDLALGGLNGDRHYGRDYFNRPEHGRLFSA